MADEQPPPASGSGSRLGEAVIIIAGPPNDQQVKINSDVASGVCLHRDTHISLFNLVATQELPQTTPATIRRANTPHVRLSPFSWLICRVPIFGISSWWGLKNFTVAAIIDPVRDVYEVFPL